MSSWKTLYMTCPTLGCPSTEMSTWNHSECRCKMEINDQAELRCSYHRDPKSIFNWKFDCGNHSHNGQPCYRDPDYKKLLSVIACASKYSDAYDDDQWLQNLMLNIVLKKPR